jgi:hypothetical protein
MSMTIEGNIMPLELLRGGRGQSGEGRRRREARHTWGRCWDAHPGIRCWRPQRRWLGEQSEEHKRERGEVTDGEVEDGDDGHSDPFHPEQLGSHDPVP